MHVSRGRRMVLGIGEPFEGGFQIDLGYMFAGTERARSRRTFHGSGH